MKTVAVQEFGISVLECMAMGKPVIATKTGGLPEIVEDGRTGILVPPCNPAALARAIVALLQDSGQRAEMGRLGRKRVTEYFTVEAMMGMMVQEYFSLLEICSIRSAIDFCRRIIISRTLYPCWKLPEVASF